MEHQLGRRNKVLYLLKTLPKAGKWKDDHVCCKTRRPEMSRSGYETKSEEGKGENMYRPQHCLQHDFARLTAK